MNGVGVGTADMVLEMASTLFGGHGDLLMKAEQCWCIKILILFRRLVTPPVWFTIIVSGRCFHIVSLPPDCSTSNVVTRSYDVDTSMRDDDSKLYITSIHQYTKGAVVYLTTLIRSSTSRFTLRTSSSDSTKAIPYTTSHGSPPHRQLTWSSTTMDR
jgi:hypothetical protein